MEETVIVPQICVIQGDYTLLHCCPKCGHLTRPIPPILTITELEVLREIGRGLSVRGVADLRNVSFKTIEAHITHMCAKLGIDTTRGGNQHTMVILARLALKMGLAQL